MNHDPFQQHTGFFWHPSWLLAFMLFLVFAYSLAAVRAHLQGKRWPLSRCFFWLIGIGCATVALVGPLATRAHHDFTAHMISHLLLGMLAPLLLALAAPLSLIFKSLNVTAARRLTRLLRSWPFRFLSHPVTASMLNIGGLWVLYTTNLYGAMQHSALAHSLIHFHVLAAGYLFTISMIYIDPAPHRTSFVYRAVVLVLALGAHGILAKYLYTQPPVGVSIRQAEIGSMLMYYGGDAVDILLIIIFCFQWYKASRPRYSLIFSLSEKGITLK